MACEFEIVVPDGSHLQAAPHPNQLVDIANLALDEIERLDGALSCFQPTSEVSFLNDEAAHRPVIASPELFEILRVAKEVWRDTDCAFDVTSGPLIELWREAEASGIAPEQQAIDMALSHVGMAHVILDEDTHAVRFDVDGIQINLGAIGKGYAVRKAASILDEYGVGWALVSAGGSTIQAIGGGPDGDGWKIGIRHPSKLDERVAEIGLKNQSMSTSGGPTQRDRCVEEHFEHIIDPVTGMSAQSEAASVSVITNDAMLSDALATAFYLRGRAHTEDYCMKYANIKMVFVDNNGLPFFTPPG